ncbi:unnamed protein product [Chilo suppressalis]|uniref:RRM domain-containing protein n=1 Tax=Chilo suppressalis TaxID=168631 RepID=A0ABN8ASW6_CHISP|nr:hypothetical protein evm_007955 [Chilo suppressalis]CAH0398944.1 unnamed protein product [Chilo suppressalis]
MKATKRTADFKALELKLTNSIFLHTIYIKEHAVREHTADRPSGRTLLVVNIPPYVDEKGITNAFSEAGAITSVEFCDKPTTAEKKAAKLKYIQDESPSTCKVAYIVFEKVSQLDKALHLSQLNPLNSEDHQIEVGMKKWINQYNNSVVMPKILKERIEIFMKHHDKEMAKAEKKEKALTEEDDEGWVTVTKRGKVQSFARSEKVENKIMEKEEKNKKRKELKNFYTFQIRESKMKHIVTLRQKFEEDKKKIAQIKQSRRFKPF